MRTPKARPVAAICACRDAHRWPQRLNRACPGDRKVGPSPEARSRWPDFGILGEGKRVFHVNPEKIPHPIFDLAMTNCTRSQPHSLLSIARSNSARSSQASAMIEVESNRPNLLRFQRTIRADGSSGVPDGPVVEVPVLGISMIILRWPEWPREERLSAP